MASRVFNQQTEPRVTREHRHDPFHTPSSSMPPPSSAFNDRSTHISMKSGLPKLRHSSQRQPSRDYQNAYRVQNKGSSNFEKARPQVPCSLQPQERSVTSAPQLRVATSQSSIGSAHDISGADSLQECVQLVRAKVADARLKLLALERLEQSINFLNEAGSDEPTVSTLITWLQTDMGSESLDGTCEAMDEARQRAEQGSHHVLQQVLAAAQAQLITHPRLPPVESPSRQYVVRSMTNKTVCLIGTSRNSMKRIDFQDEYLYECVFADIRDTTLSEMDRHRKLALLNYGGLDTSYSNGDQHPRDAGGQNSKVADDEPYQANTTSDETRQFMVRLENAQDEVSWLAAETNPANACGNFSFMSYTDPEEVKETCVNGNQQEHSPSTLMSSMTLLPEDLTKRSVSNDQISVPTPTESSFKAIWSGSHSTPALLSIYKSQDCLQQPQNQVASTIQEPTPPLPPSSVSAGAPCLRISIPSHLPTSTRFDTNPQFGTPVSAKRRVYTNGVCRLFKPWIPAGYEYCSLYTNEHHGLGGRGGPILVAYFSYNVRTTKSFNIFFTVAGFSCTGLLSKASSPLCPQPLPLWSLSLSDRFQSLGLAGKSSMHYLPSTSETQRGSTKFPLVRQHGWLGFQSLDIQIVASGRCHIAAVTRSNQVFTCWEPKNDDNDSCPRIEANDEQIEETLGRSIRTDIGTRVVQDTAFRPGLVVFNEKTSRLPSKIVKVVCLDNATFVLTENGGLWGWGSFENTDGTKVAPIGPSSFAGPVQIFTQQAANTDLAPYFVRKASQCILGAGTVTSPRISGIGAGKRTLFAWDEKRLSGWGDNTFGQLYVSGIDTVIYPRYVKPCSLNGNAIKQVRGGEGHTAILKLDGSVVTVGNNDFGQFGPLQETLSGKSKPDSETTTVSEEFAFVVNSDAAFWNQGDPLRGLLYSGSHQW
ncbi:MAG: hypothetical protein J3Q66DRAFT_420639 [Benniella sp.]|nr:MAG: hypothetical protein J3Q66DRAFT_420639 [Benniella sp.]